MVMQMIRKRNADFPKQDHQNDACAYVNKREVKHQVGHVSQWVDDLLSPPIEQRRTASVADNGLYQGALRVSRPQ